MLASKDTASTGVALVLALAAPLVFVRGDNVGQAAPTFVIVIVIIVVVIVAVVAAVVVGMPGAVAMRLACRRDELRRKLNLDMRGDDEPSPSP